MAWAASGPSGQPGGPGCWLTLSHAPLRLGRLICNVGMTVAPSYGAVARIIRDAAVKPSEENLPTIAAHGLARLTAPHSPDCQEMRHPHGSPALPSPLHDTAAPRCQVEGDACSSWRRDVFVQCFSCLGGWGGGWEAPVVFSRPLSQSQKMHVSSCSATCSCRNSEQITSHH